MRHNVSKSTKETGITGKSILSVIIFLFGITLSVTAQSHETLYPSLIDLPGWQAEAPEGMKLDMGSMKMVTAVRSYTQGDKELTATIIIGNPGMAGAVSGGKTAQMETNKAKIEATTIDGFQVQLVFDKVDHSGMVMVMLVPGQQGGAFFSLVYEGLSEDEGLALAQRFSWKKMKDKVQAFK